MANLILNGSTSGSITISSPAVSGSNTLSLPASTGTVLTTNGSGIASVNGIQFPATQSASADANTLDDYEEGTFTPTLPSGSTGVAYSVQVGKYTKIGNVVYIHLVIVLTAVSSVPGGAGSNVVEGLPFTNVADYPNLVTKWNGCNFGGTVGVCQVNPSTTNITAVGSTNNAGFVDSVPANVWDAGTNWLFLTGFYYIS
jgi:hypothetical protein